MNDQDEILQALEKDLGLPPGFCVRLNEEDDWSFVIKLHALLESAASHFLTRAIGREELADIFTRIAMSDKRTGKIAFIRQLNLLPVGHTKFIEGLSEIRNQVVHQIANVEFSLVEYFKAQEAKRNEKQFAALGDLWAFAFEIVGEENRHEPLAHRVMRIEAKSKPPEGFKLKRAHLLLAEPKATMLWSALAILEAMSLCNLFGPQMWTYLMNCSDRKDCEDSIHALFDRAKVGDPTVPIKFAQKIERLVPGIRIAYDDDGQPVFESLVAAFYLWRQSEIERTIL